MHTSSLCEPHLSAPLLNRPSVQTLALNVCKPKMAVSKVVFIGLCVLALVIGIVAGFLMGYFTQSKKNYQKDQNDDSLTHPVIVFNHAPGPCKLVKGVDTGSEDIVVLPSGLAIITAGLTYFLPKDRPDLLSRNGSLKLFDFNDVDRGARVIPITNEDNFNYADFNPHGLSAWTDGATGQVVLFVVNHNLITDLKETIEKFELNENSRRLTHLETISHKDFIVVNNVKATSSNTFYFTNFVSTIDPEEGQREVTEQIPSGSIGYYDGTQARILQRGYRSPNGINASPDGRFVYVAEYGTRKLLTFEVAGDHSITLSSQYNLNTGPDNVDVAGDYVWIGCHPFHDTIIQYANDPEVTISPSQVLRLKMEEGAVTEVTEVYMDDGHKFSGITVAVAYGNQMLIGSVFTKAMYCDLTYID